MKERKGVMERSRDFEATVRCNPMSSRVESA
jgi:hypothetical protein